jgi:hypothetical protein
MKVVQATVLVFGFLKQLIAAVAGMVIAGVGPGGRERAVGPLGSAVAGLGFGVTGAKLARSNRR